MELNDGDATPLPSALQSIKLVTIAPRVSPAALSLPPMKIALTGGMGCGKSTAARFFEEAGCTRIDSDDVIRREILTEPEVVRLAAAHFDADVLAPDGSLDRAALARVVFSDDEKLRAWEAVVHPRLFAKWRAAFATEPPRTWIVEVPLLYEKGLEKGFDLAGCVTTTSMLQYARLAERGLPHALAEARISKQLPLAKKVELADFVLSNDGTPEFLRDQVLHLLTRLGAGERR